MYISFHHCLIRLPAAPGQSASSCLRDPSPASVMEKQHHHSHAHLSSLLLIIFFLLASSSCQQLPPLSSSELIWPDMDPSVDSVTANATGSPPVYIVHVRRPNHMLSAVPGELEVWHSSFLPVCLLDYGEKRLVYSYREAISGFAARLTPEEAEAVRKMDRVLAVHPDEPLDFQTSYTPDFIGLRQSGAGKWVAPNRGDGVIIGVLDSGINPNHVSFSDAGMPKNTPKTWKGFCEFNGKPTCNNKLLGARNDYVPLAPRPPPYDANGHGTHVAATAAGGANGCASIRGLAMGIASGAAPRAHLAVYKVRTRWEALAAVDLAILDGVDILSVSMSQGQPHNLYEDDLAIAALSAVKRGILFNAAASNRGPSKSTLRNDAPWIMTVGATTTDRLLKTTIQLGNGEQIQGESLYTRVPFTSPLVYPGKDGNREAQACRQLDPAVAANNIVLCLTNVLAGFSPNEQAEAVRRSGGAAMILMNSEQRGNTISNIPDVAIPIPVIRTDFGAFAKLVDYVKKDSRPTAQVSMSTTAYDGPHPSPAVAYFSSRGPSTVNGGILKPDIVGPGVNVLAADFFSDKGFVLKSGTSMATPHLSGVAAIVKRSHSDWTPAMIKSALMTTASPRDNHGNDITDETGNSASLHALGSGQVNPSWAVRPGLVYELKYEDYLQYLCGLGYTDDQMHIFAKETVRCDAIGRKAPEELNYPSISVTLKLGDDMTKTVWRKVTNVGKRSSSYKPEWELSSQDVHVSIFPTEKLDFTEGEQREYKVTFAVSTGAAPGEVRGRLSWVSGLRQVTIPLLITIV